MRRPLNGSARTQGGGSWKLLRMVLMFSVVVFGLSRFLTLAPLIHAKNGVNSSGLGPSHPSRESGEAIRLDQISESQGNSRSQDPAFYHPHTGSLSGGNVNDDFEEEKEALDGLEYAEPGEHPKVALMFLTKGAIHNEPIWRSFLEGAAKLKLKKPAVKSQPIDLEKVVGGSLHPSIPALDESRYPGFKIQHGLVPPSKYRSTSYPHVKKRKLLFSLRSKKRSPKKKVQGDSLGCPSEREMLAAESDRLLNTPYNGPDIYQGQDLFSIYVHAQPGYSFPQKSLFSGLEIEDPVNCTNAFALHTLVLAEFKLLSEALKDPRNQKFVLLSEACVPVHPPEVVYAQAIYESKSRVHACLSRDPGRLESWRWKTKMETSHLNKKHWRKSQQWFILNRAHAQLVVDDHHVKEVFKRYCWSYGKHICVSDEHYIPTLLASYDLDDQTDCLGTGTWTDWTIEGWHPGTYTRSNVTTALFGRILNGEWPPCDPVLARRSALELFDFNGSGEGNKELSEKCIETTNGKRVDRNFSKGTPEDAASDDWISRGGYIPLGYECPLFARKFSLDALEHTVNVTLSCLGGSQGGWCKESLLASHPNIGVA